MVMVQLHLVTRRHHTCIDDAEIEEDEEGDAEDEVGINDEETASFTRARHRARNSELAGCHFATCTKHIHGASSSEDPIEERNYAHWGVAPCHAQ